MTTDLIRKLNQLNQDFYQKVAPDFDNSRQYSWDGWKQLLPIFTQEAVRNHFTVVDLGCGNGRFGLFLDKQFPQLRINYIGLDTNPFLLQQAKVSLDRSNMLYSLHHFDIVEELLAGTFHTTLSKLLGNKVKGPFIYVAFGVLHHLPSHTLRQQFVTNLTTGLDVHHQPSAIVVTVWQFMNDEQQQKKISDPSNVGIKTEELEPNDYILSWNRGVEAYRYCHHLDEQELLALELSVTNYQLTTFLADGKSGQLNRYLVLTKSQE